LDFPNIPGEGKVNMGVDILVCGNFHREAPLFDDRPLFEEDFLSEADGGFSRVLERMSCYFWCLSHAVKIFLDQA
jgi:hypothetical protein